MLPEIKVLYSTIYIQDDAINKVNNEVDGEEGLGSTMMSFDHCRALAQVKWVQAVFSRRPPTGAQKVKT